jgi:hypothetical protein
VDAPILASGFLTSRTVQSHLSLSLLSPLPGFAAPPCTPGEQLETGYCFDTSVLGNSTSAHEYGTTLPPAAKEGLVAYLKTL